MRAFIGRVLKKSKIILFFKKNHYKKIGVADQQGPLHFRVRNHIKKYYEILEFNEK